MMLLVHGQQKERLYGGDIVFLQPPLKPGAVKMQSVEIALEQPPVADEHSGQAGVVQFVVLGAPGGQGLVLRIQEYGQLSVGFQNGVLHGGKIYHALLAQLFNQLVHSKAGAAHFVLQHMAFLNDDGGASADQIPEANTFQV